MSLLYILNIIEYSDHALFDVPSAPDFLISQIKEPESHGQIRHQFHSELDCSVSEYSFDVCDNWHDDYEWN